MLLGGGSLLSAEFVDLRHAHPRPSRTAKIAHWTVVAAIGLYLLAGLVSRALGLLAISR
jgi:hypothetical protein